MNSKAKAQDRWHNMMQRCYNPKAINYARYGGRGIRVCPEWHDFDTYYWDVGDPPQPGLTLDRIDNDGHYEPSNVQWATWQQQMQNRNPYKATGGRPKGTICQKPYKNQQTLIYDGDVLMTIQEAAGWHRCSYKAIAGRLRKIRRATGATRVDIKELQ